jgi:hypothetical protein
MAILDEGEKTPSFKKARVGFADSRSLVRISTVMFWEEARQRFGLLSTLLLRMDHILNGEGSNSALFQRRLLEIFTRSRS